jgi:NAD(P)-dependent dehydrogenase (short-subunit alcohol dehydrogenase family)
VTVLVTGSTGNVGSRVVTQLVGQGVQVRWPSTTSTRSGSCAVEGYGRRRSDAPRATTARPRPLQLPSTPGPAKGPELDGAAIPAQPCSASILIHHAGRHPTSRPYSPWSTTCVS